mmetsp:Transcript_130895/g.226507  ORF Transcript_130895/g.226507 Transcript_130895/m.226507 type:complete len:214 (+) Transcript_130895:197-838(+)
MDHARQRVPFVSRPLPLNSWWHMVTSLGTMDVCPAIHVGSQSTTRSKYQPDCYVSSILTLLPQAHRRLAHRLPIGAKCKCLPRVGEIQDTCLGHAIMVHWENLFVPSWQIHACLPRTSYLHHFPSPRHTSVLLEEILPLYHNPEHGVGFMQHLKTLVHQSLGQPTRRMGKFTSTESLGSLRNTGFVVIYGIVTGQGARMGGSFAHIGHLPTLF